MADVSGFRGIRYAFDRFDSPPEELLAPPYDVIDEDEQAELYERHPNNVIRLVLNRIRDGDDAENNRYTRARRLLMDWLADGTLRLDDERALYAHEQAFEEGGETYRRLGFLGLVRLSPYEDRIVLPHEETHRGPKEDRLKLMKACECNLSPIFLLYDDPEREIESRLRAAIDDRPADLDVETEHDGIRHRLWPVFDGQTQCKIAGELADDQLLIADGHHRYETALTYREFRRKHAEHPDRDAPWNYVLAFLVNMHSPGLKIFPTHRIVHSLPDFDPDGLVDSLQASESFDVGRLDGSTVDDPDAVVDDLESSGTTPAFALLGDAFDAPLRVEFTGGLDAPVFDEETRREVRRLDTAVLRDAIVDDLLGIGEDAREEKRYIRYTRDGDEALDAVDDEETQMVVMMKSPSIENVVDVCRAGGKMPQKSTYFYPKILSGLAFNPL
ncbi:MAG: DUF1015 domain-containing protein [Bradymonadaceae bacterium]